MWLIDLLYWEIFGKPDEVVEYCNTVKHAKILKLCHKQMLEFPEVAFKLANLYSSNNESNIN